MHRYIYIKVTIRTWYYNTNHYVPLSWNLFAIALKCPYLWGETS